jgi:hypothetical protein
MAPLEVIDMTDGCDPETYTEAETEARREAALKRMFAMPHKPHKTRDNADGKQGRKRPTRV